jgi:hypothetical protein
MHTLFVIFCRSPLLVCGSLDEPELRQRVERAQSLGEI